MAADTKEWRKTERIIMITCISLSRNRNWEDIFVQKRVASQAYCVYRVGVKDSCIQPFSALICIQKEYY